MWRWLRYAPGCNTRKSDTCALDTSTSSSSGMMHRRSRRVSSEASGGFGIENCPARRAPTPQESVHSSSDREQVVAQIGPSLSPVAHSRGAQSGSAKQASTSSVSEQAVRMFLILLNVFIEPVCAVLVMYLHPFVVHCIFMSSRGIFTCRLGRI